MQENSNRSAGIISVGLAMLTGTLSLGLVVQDWYVDVNAPSCGTGTGTQVDPFCDIVDAVAAASDGDTIHIAPGTYFENVLIDEDLDLVGTGGELVTILDGMSIGPVVWVQHGIYLDPETRVSLTGLTLTHGQAQFHPSWTSSRTGGGLFMDGYSSVVLSSCTVRENVAYGMTGIIQAGLGAGIYSEGTLTLIDSTVDSNSVVVLGSGGGIFAANGTVSLVNSMISGNVGGGISSFLTSLTLTNTSVDGNADFGVYSEAGAPGGLTISNSRVTDSEVGVWVFDDTLTMTNSTVSGNAGKGIFVESSSGYAASASLANCVLWNDGTGSIVLTGPSSTASVDYSLVEGGWSGIGNIDADPLFVDWLGGDFRLLPGSPCIDAGDNLAVPQGLWVDLSGKRRFIDDPSTPDTGNPGHLLPIVDMGAHEFGLDPPRKVRDGRGVKIR